MLGFTRIYLLILESLRSVWVVVIGLELLSLACPDLGLGSGYVASFYTCVTLLFFCHCGYYFLLVWRIGFGVIGMKLDRCDANSSRLCSVRC
jgi:hypothetical protein